MAASYTGFRPHERDSGGFVHSFKLGIKCRKVNFAHQKLSARSEQFVQVYPNAKSCQLCN
jgi:hypothetical protein